MCDVISQAKRRIAWSGKRSRISLLVVEVSPPPFHPSPFPLNICNHRLPALGT